MSYKDTMIRNLADARERMRKEDEEEQKKGQFNLGSLIPAAIATIAAPFTGGASLASLPGMFAAKALPYALGEGLRAATKSDTDYGALAGGLWDKFAPLKPLEGKVAEKGVAAAVEGGKGISSLKMAGLPELTNPLAKEYGMDAVKLGLNKIDSTGGQLGGIPGALSSFGKGVKGTWEGLSGAVGDIGGEMGKGFGEGMFRTESPQQREARTAYAEAQESPGLFKQTFAVDETGNIKRGLEQREPTDLFATLKKLKDAGYDVAPLIKGISAKGLTFGSPPTPAKTSGGGRSGVKKELSPDEAKVFNASVNKEADNAEKIVLDSPLSDISKQRVLVKLKMGLKKQRAL